MLKDGIWLRCDWREREVDGCMWKGRCAVWVAPRVTWEWFPLSQLCIFDYYYYTNSKLCSTTYCINDDDVQRTRQGENERDRGSGFVRKKSNRNFSPLSDTVLLNLTFLKSNCIHPSILPSLSLFLFLLLISSKPAFHFVIFFQLFQLDTFIVNFFCR